MNKRLIFCCTPGRSGTNLLAKLLSLVPSICSVHEAKPSFDNYFWRTTNPILDYDKTSYIYKKFWELKLKAIERDTDKLIYSETSHMTFKGFIEFLPNDIEFSVIFLHRDPRDVAKSLYAINDIPGRSRTGKRVCFDPSDNHNIINIADKWTKLSNYQLCYWYVLEMYKRSEMYWSLCHSKLRAKITLSQLLEPTKFQAMLAELQLPTNIDLTAYENITSAKWNTKSVRKKHVYQHRVIVGLRSKVDCKEEEKAINNLITH